MNRFLPLLLGFFLTSLAWSDDLVDDETVESTHVVMHKIPAAAVVICGPNTCGRMGSRWSLLKTTGSLVSKPIEKFPAR